MEPSRFDDLTKALATTTSRRQALKTIAATTLGSILALSGMGTVFAKNKTCAQFCNAVFGADTHAAGQCISDAAHHKGLCSSCGSNADPSSICCTRNSSGFCTSYSPTLPCSCGANQICQNGQCVTPCPTTGSNNGGTCTQNADCCSGNCTNGFCCDAGRVGLNNGSCAVPCASQADCSGCGTCLADFSGASYCAQDVVGQFCEDDSMCPHGQFCQGDSVACVELC